MMFARRIDEKFDKDTASLLCEAQQWSIPVIRMSAFRCGITVQDLQIGINA